MDWLHSLKKNTKRIYLDFAATTPVDRRVSYAMEPYLHKHFGNPSSIHEEGVIARDALHAARTKIARALRVRSEEIVFTSGGTEANNLAIRGVIEAEREKGKVYQDMHVITSVAEHVSVLECVRSLERDGVEVTYLGIDDRGHIDPEEVVDAIRSATVLISLMYVNNEVGTITPLRKIVERVRSEEKDAHPLFHTDASQAPLYLDCSPEYLGVDLLSVDAQKLYGPKGIGFLFHRRTISPKALLYGGDQEGGMRPGTEPVELIVGLAEAFSLAVEHHRTLSGEARKLRDYFIAGIKEAIPQAELNGDGKSRVANNVNIFIPNTDAEFLVVQLDKRGVAASTASACLKEGKASHVIEALKKGDTYPKSSLRFTLGRETTKKEIKRAIVLLKECVEEQARDPVFDKTDIS